MFHLDAWSSDWATVMFWFGGEGAVDNLTKFGEKKFVCSLASDYSRPNASLKYVQVCFFPVSIVVHAHKSCSTVFIQFTFVAMSPIRRYVHCISNTYNVHDSKFKFPKNKWAIPRWIPTMWTTFFYAFEISRSPHTKQRLIYTTHQWL